MADCEVLSFTVVGVNVRIRCAETRTRTLLTAHYGRMRTSPAAELVDAAELRYGVDTADGMFRLSLATGDAVLAADRGELLFALDQDLSITLQKLRPDLYFIHAAALETAGNIFMLVAPSGSGKSTTAWALSHHGIRYLSDELAPVDLATLIVHPYPRALVLKNLPPSGYPVAANTLSTSRGFLVAPEAMSGGIRVTPAPLRGIFFLRYPATSTPAARPMSAAEAGARLYANALNPLAHPEDGLGAALHIAQSACCFELSTGDLADTCAVVKATLDQILRR